jgi:hypothetical protein
MVRILFPPAESLQLSAAILGQNPPFVASHLRNSHREQNGFDRGTGHDTAGKVIRCSIAARCLGRALGEAFSKPTDERL